MTRKSKIVIWVAVLAVLLGGFLALRIHSWNQTYGLSQDVIEGTVEPSAEETIRLYFYYSNRRNHKAVEQLLQSPHVNIFAHHAWWDDLKIVSIDDGDTYHNAGEWGNAYEVVTYEVDFNEGFLVVSSKEGKNSDYDTFTLIQKEKGDPWKIESIGKG